jgi:phosphatidylethanolamine/phosphatidyl-N-methylethanolamine N-methyltransferase
MPINTAWWNRFRYTLYAPLYDVLTRPFSRGRQRAIELLNVQAGESILIVGAGTGLDLPFLSTRANITAIDLTPAMVERTQQRAMQLGRSVDVSVMNAEALTFSSASFDCVILHLILAVVPDPVACASEVARVLKPGGRVSIYDKFLPDRAQPSLLRRGLNFITNVAFSDINRQLEPILLHTGLHLTHEEPAPPGGAYRVALATHVATKRV